MRIACYVNFLRLPDGGEGGEVKGGLVNDSEGGDGENACWAGVVEGTPPGPFVHEVPESDGDDGVYLVSFGLGCTSICYGFVKLY